MGAHHYKLEVVPRRFIEQFSNPIPMEIVYEGLQPWLDEKPDEKLLDSLRILLPNDKSWGVEEYVSANDWGSDIRIWKEDEIIENIVFRYSEIDDWNLMISFLNIVKELDYVVIHGGYVIEPDEKEIRNDFRNSAAGQFKNDPESAIIRAAKGAKEFFTYWEKGKYNDQFRESGSKYNKEETVAFLALNKGEEIDWQYSIGFDCAYDILYIPETIFEEILKKAKKLNLNNFKNFKLYNDKRFSGDILFTLLSEIGKIKDSVEDQDVIKAIELIVEKIEKCISSTELELAFVGY
ncbi:MAG: hypothetical protein IPJ23_07470 [Ignavibacteriales bacterium]|nr:hypothetical protein [Ignavibacteriales bacterium]